MAKSALGRQEDAEPERAPDGVAAEWQCKRARGTACRIQDRAAPGQRKWSIVKRWKRQKHTSDGDAEGNKPHQRSARTVPLVRGQLLLLSGDRRGDSGGEPGGGEGGAGMSRYAENTVQRYTM